MNDIIYIDALTATDAGALARLERSCKARGHRHGKKHFHDLLKFVDKTGWGLNLGLYAGTRLIGYILSHDPDFVSTNRVADDPVMHTDAVAVHPKYRQHFAYLATRYLRYLQTLYPVHTIEAAGADSVVRFATRHRKFFLRTGYQLVATDPIAHQAPGPAQFTVRWRPVPTSAARSAHKWHTTHRQRFSYRLHGQAYSVETLTDESAWSGLVPYWNQLLLKTPESTMFQTYEYQRIWWRHFGLSRRLLILVMRHDDAIIGIAPLQISPAVYYGKCFRELGFIGVNWEVDRPKFLFGDQAAICSTLTARFLTQNAQLWDLIRLYEQREDSFVLSSFCDEMHGYGYLTAVTKDAVAPYLRTDTDWDTFSQIPVSAHAQKPQKRTQEAGSNGQIRIRRIQNLPRGFAETRMVQTDRTEKLEGCGPCRSQQA